LEGKSAMESETVISRRCRGERHSHLQTLQRRSRQPSPDVVRSNRHNTPDEIEGFIVVNKLRYTESSMTLVMYRHHGRVLTVVDLVHILLREYVALHIPYPLHLTTVRTCTLKLPLVLLKGVMTQG
jgi:hypothetical protein